MGALLTTRIGIITLLFADNKETSLFCLCCRQGSAALLLLCCCALPLSAAVDCGGAFAMCNLGSVYPCIS